MKPSAWVVLACLLGCGEGEARPQWTVLVTTDASLPQLGDRLLVDVVDDDGELLCEGCRRVFGNVEGSGWPLSFGVRPADSPPHIRARLFRAVTVGDDGEPATQALVDVTMRLSADFASVELPLPMRCFGVVDDAPDVSCSPEGRLDEIASMTEYDEETALVPGTWRATDPCERGDDDAMVCIPGHAFLMGDATMPPLPAGLDARREMLVATQPFAIDRDEVRVGTVRRLVERGVMNLPLPPPAPDPYTGCTYRGDGTTDPLPMNCIARADAARVCRALDKELPTEAEWELAAGNGDRETTFPWGASTDVCGHAVVGRGADGAQTHNRWCRSGDAVVVAGLARVDEPVVDVNERGVRSLGGSLGEWTADDFTPYGEGCWTWSGTVVEDPICEAVNVPASVRGSNWAGVELAARGASRSFSDAAAPSPLIGFRCVKRE